jgi:hypothetical protein
MLGDEMRIATRRWFPSVIAIVHLLLAVLVFALAMRNPERSGLLPILIFTIDAPFSILISYVAGTFGISPETGYNASLWSDMAFFAVLGTVWWYAIGYAIIAGLDWLKAYGKRVA